MVNWLNIRDARPGDAPFLAKCILSGMHFYDFETYPSDHMAGILSGLTASETLEDTLYTFMNTRVAELNGTPAGALLSYPGEEYLSRKERTFREFWPEYFSEHSADVPETDPGEWYLDSLAVHPEFRNMGIGKALLQDGIRKGSRRGSTGWRSLRTLSTRILSGSTSRWGSCRKGQGTPSGLIS